MPEPHAAGRLSNPSGHGLIASRVVDDLSMATHGRNVQKAQHGVKCLMHSPANYDLFMETMGDRLRKARIDAGFESASDGAARAAVKYYTYAQHENGTREFPAKRAESYARAFGVDVSWLLYGRGTARRDSQKGEVPLVGYVGAGAAMNLYSEGQGPFGYVAAPSGSNDKTVAAEVRGDSLGSFFNQWLVFYDDVHAPVSPGQIGELCVCGLSDGRVLVKKIQRAKQPGLFHLLSQTEEPILDVPLDWAARVTHMRPR